MICTFGDLTDVIWWRELSLPVRTVIGRDGRFEPVRLRRGAVPLALPRAGERGLRRARRARPSARRSEGSSSCSTEDGAHRRRAAADHARGQVLRARRASARDRLLEPVVRADDAAPRRAPRRRARAQVAPRVHAGTLRIVGRGAERRLEHLPPALLRRAVPALVPDRRGRRDRRARRSCPRSPRCRSTRHRRARRLRANRSGTSRAASPATPT